jgi:hypothetical protein
MSSSTARKKCVWKKTEKGDWIRRRSSISALVVASCSQ